MLDMMYFDFCTRLFYCVMGWVDALEQHGRYCLLEITGFHTSKVYTVLGFLYSEDE